MTTREEIEAILNKGESVQIVGISGIGKSRLLHDLDAIFIDTSVLYPIEYISLLQNFAHSLDIDTKSTNAVEIQDQISKRIGDKKLVIIIDGFEKIVKSEFTQFFNFLKSLRDLHKQSLSYIFSVSGINPIDSAENEKLGDLFRIVQENIVYVKPYPKEGFESLVKLKFSSNLEDQQIDFDELYKLTGGIASLVKAKLKDNELLINSQISEIRKQIKNASQETLKKHGLVNDKGQIISDLLKDSSKDNSELTVLESSLFNVLKENLNDIVSKDKICEAVYPEVKSKNGISDSSIDQLVHRLKKKLTGYSITNQHGRGFKMTVI